MSYDREEAGRQQDATEGMIAMREALPGRVEIATPKAGTERVTFRLIQTPCCMSLLCWVNPRLPSHCPECGKGIYPAVKSCVLVHDPDATLRTTPYRVTTDAPS